MPISINFVYLPIFDLNLCLQFLSFSDLSSSFIHTPIHVHVIKDGKEAKYNVEPTVVQVFNHGFKKHEISMIESILEENVNVIKERWQEYFGQEK